MQLCYSVCMFEGAQNPVPIAPEEAMIPAVPPIEITPPPQTPEQLIQEQSSIDWQEATNSTTGILHEAITNSTTTKAQQEELQPVIDALGKVDQAEAAGTYNSQTGEWELRNQDGTVAERGNVKDTYPEVVDSLLSLQNNPKAVEIGQRLARRLWIDVITTDQNGTEVRTQYPYEEWVKVGKPSGNRIQSDFYNDEPAKAEGQTNPTENKPVSAEPSAKPEEQIKHELEKLADEVRTELTLLDELKNSRINLEGRTPTEQADTVKELQKMFPGAFDEKGKLIKDLTPQQLTGIKYHQLERARQILGKYPKQSKEDIDLDNAITANTTFIRTLLGEKGTQPIDTVIAEEFVSGGILARSDFQEQFLKTYKYIEAHRQEFQKLHEERQADMLMKIPGFGGEFELTKTQARRIAGGTLTIGALLGFLLLMQGMQSER